MFAMFCPRWDCMKSGPQPIGTGSAACGGVWGAVAEDVLQRQKDALTDRVTKARAVLAQKNNEAKKRVAVAERNLIAHEFARQRRLAEITEMIHAASLLHDDVLDLADARRSAQRRSRGTHCSSIVGMDGLYSGVPTW